MKARGITLAAGTLVLAAVAWLPATQAQAVPANCTANKYGNGATAYCYTSASGSQFRAVAKCRYQTSSGSYDYSNAYGTWRTQGDQLNSTATCSQPFGVYDWTAQTR